MARCEIRYLPDDILLALKKMAREENKSQDQFLREQLILIVNGRKLSEEIKSMEAEFIQQISSVLEETHQVLGDLMAKI